jgi:hypothetical protein
MIGSGCAEKSLSCKPIHGCPSNAQTALLRPNQEIGHYRDPSWSPDARIAYARVAEGSPRYTAIWLYSLHDKKSRQVTSGSMRVGRRLIEPAVISFEKLERVFSVKFVNPRQAKVFKSNWLDSWKCCRAEVLVTVL